MPNGRGHILHAKEKNLHPMDVISAWKQGPPEDPELKRARQKAELQRALIGVALGGGMLLCRQYNVSDPSAILRQLQ